jgi:hypothetical protein
MRLKAGLVVTEVNMTNSGPHGKSWEPVRSVASASQEVFTSREQ